MRVFWYFLTAIFGLIGVLAILRTVELLALGERIIPVQIGIAAVTLTLAVTSLQRARSSAK
jgi:hypothetical protein